MLSTSHEIIRKGSAEELIGHRNRALEYYRLGLEWITKAFEAQKMAAPGSCFPECLRERGAVDLQHSGVDKAMDAVKRELDCAVWTYLIGATELQSLMDAETLDRFRKQVRAAPPEVTLDNLISTLSDLRDRRGSILQQSLVNVFKKLNRAYANNDAFRLGKTIILEYAIGSYVYGGGLDRVADLDRLFHVLDGKAPSTHLGDAAVMVRETSWRHEGAAETEYFRFRLYRNGNLHMIFKRSDLVAKANKIVADFYGETLADGRRMA